MGRYDPHWFRIVDIQNLHKIIFLLVYNMWGASRAYGQHSRPNLQKNDRFLPFLTLAVRSGPPGPPIWLGPILFERSINLSRHT